MMKLFDFRQISNSRKELMGVAAILILICHAPGNSVMMPLFLAKLFSYGNVGVDVFLLLSGVGLFFSLEKSDKSTFYWYSKRFIRIFVPYLIITIPYLLYKVCFMNYGFDDVILNILTISYWLSGDGDWYISLILLIYIITPPLFVLFYNKTGIKRWGIAVLICLIFSAMAEFTSSFESLLPFCKAISRVPAFVLGVVLVPYIKERVKMNVFYIVVATIVLLILYNFIFPHGNILWILALSVIVISCVLIEKVSFLKKIVTFIGAMSLESYLWNVHLGDILNHLSWKFGEYDLSYGHYLEYATVLTIGIVFAYLCYLIDKKVVEYINRKLLYNV